MARSSRDTFNIIQDSIIDYMTGDIDNLSSSAQSSVFKTADTMVKMNAESQRSSRSYWKAMSTNWMSMSTEMARAGYSAQAKQYAVNAQEARNVGESISSGKEYYERAKSSYNMSGNKMEDLSQYAGINKLENELNPELQRRTRHLNLAMKYGDENLQGRAADAFTTQSKLVQLQRERNQGGLGSSKRDSLDAEILKATKDATTQSEQLGKDMLTLNKTVDTSNKQSRNSDMRKMTSSMINILGNQGLSSVLSAATVYQTTGAKRALSGTKDYDVMMAETENERRASKYGAIGNVLGAVGGGTLGFLFGGPAGVAAGAQIGTVAGSGGASYFTHKQDAQTAQAYRIQHYQAMASIMSEQLDPLNYTRDVMARGSSYEQMNAYNMISAMNRRGGGTYNADIQSNMAYGSSQLAALSGQDPKEIYQELMAAGKQGGFGDSYEKMQQLMQQQIKVAENGNNDIIANLQTVQKYLQGGMSPSAAASAAAKSQMLSPAFADYSASALNMPTLDDFGKAMVLSGISGGKFSLQAYQNPNDPRHEEMVQYANKRIKKNLSNYLGDGLQNKGMTASDLSDSTLFTTLLKGTGTPGFQGNVDNLKQLNAPVKPIPETQASKDAGNDALNSLKKALENGITTNTMSINAIGDINLMGGGESSSGGSSNFRQVRPGIASALSEVGGYSSN